MIKPYSNCPITKNFLYQSSDSIVIILSKEFLIEDANNATINYLNISLSSILNKHLDKIISFENVEESYIYSEIVTEFECFFLSSPWKYRFKCKIQKEICEGELYFIALFSRISSSSNRTNLFDRYEEITENSPNGIIIIENRSIVYTNNTLSTITGYSREELRQIREIDLAIAEEKERVGNFSKNVFAHKEHNSELEFWAYKKDKSRIYIHNTYVQRNDFQYIIVQDFTSKKVSDITRKHTEERSNALLSAIPDMMFLFDMNGTIIDFHHKEPHKLYKRPDDFLFKHISHVLPPNLVELTLDKIEQVVSTSKNIIYEYEIDIDGKIENYESRLVQCGDNNFLSIVRDISHEKQTINALQESELRFRQTIENAPVSIIILDTNGKILYLNPKTIELLECNNYNNAYEIIKRDIWEHPVHRKELIEKVLENSSISNYEISFNTSKNKSKWAIISSEKIRYQENTAILSTILDITHRRQSEIDIQIRDSVLEEVSNFASKSLLASSFEAIISNTLSKIGRTLNVGGVCMFKLDDHHTVSRKFLWINELLKNLSLKNFKDKYDLDEVGLLWWIDQLSQRKTIIGKSSSFSKEEQKLLSSIYIKTYLLVPILEKDHLWGFLGFDDYTEERNWMSPEIDALQTVADIFGAAISRESAFNHLLKAKEDAEELNKLKSNFLSNMSHELRTPLIGILGSADIIEKEEKLVDAKKWASIIKNSGSRLLESLNLILDFSKLEAQKVTTNFQLINIVDVINDIVSLFSAVAISKKIELVHNTTSQSILVQIDLRLFRESIINLISNAIKFTKIGGITIDLKTENSELILNISDTGIGIPADKVSQIFEEFRQESEGLNRSFEGTGLGLTITKGFIELMNGSISVESEFGKGSVFTIKLPIYQQTNIPNSLLFSNNISSELPQLKNTTSQFSKIHSILLVENDEITSILIKKYLQKEISVTHVSNGNAAVNLCKHKFFNLILMDINLGEGMNGLEVTNCIRKIAIHKNTPIVAITAFAIEGDKEEFMLQGCSHYLAKPFSKEQLLSYIHQIDQELSNA